MFAVGSDDSNVSYGGKVQIYEYNENTRQVMFKPLINVPAVYVFIYMSLTFY